jgi:D-alanyl-D-alanine carboxypeptidase
MRSWLVLVLVLAAGLALAGPPALRAQEASTAVRTEPGDPALQRRFAAALDAFREARGVPGSTAALVLPDGSLLAAASGRSDVEAGRPMGTGDRMMSGSVGKMFFAAVILLAVADGELDLDAPLAEVLGEAEWFDRLPNAEALSLRILLRHRSGIPEHVQVPAFIAACRDQPDRVWKPEDLLAFIFDREPLFAADAGFAYADTNYIVAGMVYERATGRRIAEAVRARILGPLDLRDTVPSDRRRIDGLVPGYGAADSPFGLSGRLLDVDGRFVINPQMEWTGGGFALTTGDLVRFVRALFDGRVLAAPELDAMRDLVPAPGLGSYGLGLIGWKSAHGPALGHSGWFPGYLCQVAHYPERQLTVAVSVNTDDFRAVGSLRRVVDELAAAVLDPRSAPDARQRR